MNNEKLNVSSEMLKNISADELVDLKIEVDELISKLDNVEKMCDDALNS